MTPFVLKGRRQLPPESAPSSDEIYDRHRQLWIDRESGEPLVRRMQHHVQPSQFGETTITETREGVDQSEVASLTASEFGETTVTKTREGADQSESTLLHPSDFGETTMTRTREGHDQSEVTAPSVYSGVISDKDDLMDFYVLVPSYAPYYHF